MLALLAYPILITALAFACQWRLLPKLPRLGDVQPAPASIDAEAYHAMFGIAHHDIWWAKEHAWTIITYVVGVVVTLVVVDMKDLLAPERIALGLLYVLTAGLAIYYTGRMQSDMAVARIRSAYLVRHTPGLHRLVEALVGDDRDYYRGAYFMLTLGLLSSGVAAIAVAVLIKNTVCGWGTYAVLGAASLASIHLQVGRRARRDCGHLFAMTSKG